MVGGVVGIAETVFGGFGEDVVDVGVGVVAALDRGVKAGDRVVVVAEESGRGGGGVPGVVDVRCGAIGSSVADGGEARQVVVRNCIIPRACAHPSGECGSGMAANPGRPSSAGPMMGGWTSPVAGSTVAPWKVPCPDSMAPMAAMICDGSPAHVLAASRYRAWSSGGISLNATADGDASARVGSAVTMRMGATSSSPRALSAPAATPPPMRTCLGLIVELPIDRESGPGATSERFRFGLRRCCDRLCGIPSPCGGFGVDAPRYRRTRQAVGSRSERCKPWDGTERRDGCAGQLGWLASRQIGPVVGSSM